jgi:hypothetical protein
MNHFICPPNFKSENINIALNANPKKGPIVGYGDTNKNLSFVTPPATTKYPRVSGDGNFCETNPYSPESVDKASYTMDLQDFADDQIFLDCIEKVDDALLKFVTTHQKQVLNRQNLSEAEVKMLQHRNVKHKEHGQKIITLACRKFYTDTVGNRRERKPLICDELGAVMTNGTILPNDIVRSTMTSGAVWNFNGKFGLRWELGDISLVRRPEASPPLAVHAFAVSSEA